MRAQACLHVSTLLAAGLALVSTSEAQAASHSACSTTRQVTTAQRGEPEFAQLVHQLNRYFSRPDKARSEMPEGAVPPRPLVAPSATRLRVEAEYTFCAEGRTADPMASTQLTATSCNEGRCEQDPTAAYDHLPSGSEVSIVTCGSGTFAQRVYAKDSNDLWEMTRYSQKQSNSCPET